MDTPTQPADPRATTPLDPTLEQRTLRTVTLRLVPLLILCYLVAYLDRVNVGFAALTMNRALGLDTASFGLGAGIFFLAYFLFEIPSNLALERFGARRWIARIMLSWGVLSGLTAYIQPIARATGLSDTHTFYALRFLLGLAEAGFFPGIVFYLTLWFPAAYRARVTGYFMAAVPLSSVIGSPISGALLTLNGAGGLAGWQWLFVMEAVPAILLALVLLAILPDTPEQARFLAPAQRTWLATTLATERARREATRRFTILEAIGDTRILLLAFIYFGTVTALYGLGFFLPTIVHGFGLSLFDTGLVTAIPYLAGTIGMVWWSRHSDRTRERREHVALAALLAGAGIACSLLFDGATGKMIALTIASLGIFAMLPVFWTLPTALLAGPAAAAGIAAINALGNLAGFFGPYAVGKIHNQTGSFTIGLLAIASTCFLAMLVALSLPHDSETETGVRE